jgi:hypothetical protein
MVLDHRNAGNNGWIYWLWESLGPLDQYRAAKRANFTIVSWHSPPAARYLVTGKGS